MGVNLRTKKKHDNLRNIEGAREEDKVKLAEFDVSYVWSFDM